MKMHDIPFGTTDWSAVEATEHRGETGVAHWRTRHFGPADDRIERRNQVDLSPDELAAIRARLDRMDRTGGTPWTRQVLRLIERYPGVVSTALARRTGLDRAVFKVQVRKLKELGLTESLDVGYRLSPLGEAVVRELG